MQLKLRPGVTYLITRISSMRQPLISVLDSPDDSSYVPRFVFPRRNLLFQEWVHETPVPFTNDSSRMSP